MNRSFTRLLFLLFTFFILPFTLSAQYYKWLQGGGSNAAIQNEHEQVTHMCTDDNGNVYILALVGDHNIKADSFFMASAFNTGGVGVAHTLFASYSCDGKMRFAKLFESYDYTYGHGIVYDKGKVYVSGMMQGTNKRIGYDDYYNTQYQNGFLIKYDTNGQYGWTKFVGPEIASNYAGISLQGALAIDGQGNIHHYFGVRTGVQLSPTVIGQAGNYDLKYDVNGTLLSVTRLQLADTAYFIKKVEIDNVNNNAYALFEIGGGSTTYSPNYLIRFDAIGNQVWMDTISTYSALDGFRYKAGDGVYVCGVASSGNHVFSIGGMTVSNTWDPIRSFGIIGKLDAMNGKAKWLRHIDGSSSTTSFKDIELLPNNTIAATGVFLNKAKYGNDSIQVTTGEIINPWLMIMDTAGKLQVWDQLHGQGNYDIGTVLTSDKKGNVYIGGTLNMSIGAPGLTPYTSNGSSDFFVMKYGVACHCTPSDAPVSNYNHAAGTNPKQVQFTYTGTGTADSVVWDFGDGTAKVKQNNPTHTYTTGGTYNVCATAYNECGINKQCKLVQVTVGINDIALDNVRIYPNPVTDKLTIEGATTGTIISLYDITGRLLQTTTATSTATSNRTELNTANLPAGNYMLQLIGSDGSKKMVKLQK